MTMNMPSLLRRIEQLERTIERMTLSMQSQPLNSSRLLPQPLRLAKTASYGGEDYPNEESGADTFGIIFQDGDFEETTGTTDLTLVAATPSANRVAKSIPSKWFAEGTEVVVAEIDGQFYILSWIEGAGGGSTNVCNQISSYASHNLNLDQVFWHPAGGSCSWTTICAMMKTVLDYTPSAVRDQYFVIDPSGVCHMQVFNFCKEVKESVSFNTTSDDFQYLALTPFVSPNGGLACTFRKINICEEIKKLTGENTTQNQLVFKRKDVSGTPGICELVTICDILKTITGYSEGQTRRQFVSILGENCEVSELDLCTELKLDLTGHDDDVDQWIGHDAGSSICKWIEKPKIGLFKATVTATSIPPNGTGNLNLGGNTVTGRWQWAEGDWTLLNGCEVWVQHVVGTASTYDIVTTNDCSKATRPA